MRLIFLSPHLDDAVYSSGGWIWQQVQGGQSVEIWTIFAGNPKGSLTAFAQELHQRWGTGPDAVLRRREEDEHACTLLGAGFRHFDFPDCIYRRIPTTDEPVISTNDELFQPVKDGELPLADQIGAMLQSLDRGDALMLCPLAIGGHVDHRLVRMAAERSHLPLAYYADFPYAAETPLDLMTYLPKGARQVHFSLSQQAIERWVQAVAAYASQLSSFWASTEEMSRSVNLYASSQPGSSLWM